MRVEKKTLVFSAIVNFLVALVKIIGGNVFGFISLIADGFYTVSDFITDILAIAGAQIGKRRPNKRHPLGYGNFEYVMQMIMGFMIMLVGIVVIFMSFNITYVKPDWLVILVILLVVVLKIYSSKMLLQVGKKINSSMLITSSKESFLDALSSSILIVVIIASYFYNKADMIGSIFIGLLIIYQAFKIISQNGVLLIGENVKDAKIEEALNKIFRKYKKIKLLDYVLIKHGSYYQLILNINLNKDYTVKSLIKAELNIKKEIMSKRLGIKFIDFDIDSKIRN